jgi:serine/threonine-protein kinase
MLTGKMPFEGKGVELLVAMMRDTPVPPSSRVSGVPADIEELVLRLIARSADERPRDAFLVHDMLAEMLQRHAGEPEQTPKDGEEDAKVERESVPTLVDEPAQADYEDPASSEPSSERAADAKQLVGSGEIVARWHQMIDKLGARIEAATGLPSGAIDAKRLRRACELAGVAGELRGSLDRARAMITNHQGEVDRLEAHGRSFRATLGHAIDTLSRDLSQEKAHLDAILAHRQGMGHTSTARDLDARRKETLFWEEAALATEEQRVRSVAEDLTYQMTALQKQLDLQNEELDVKLTDATGKLEGALNALRRIQTEFFRTVEEANAALV